MRDFPSLATQPAGSPPLLDSSSLSPSQPSVSQWCSRNPDDSPMDSMGQSASSANHAPASSVRPASHPEPGREEGLARAKKLVQSYWSQRPKLTTETTIPADNKKAASGRDTSLFLLLSVRCLRTLRVPHFPSNTTLVHFLSSISLAHSHHLKEGIPNSLILVSLD